MAIVLPDGILGNDGLEYVKKKKNKNLPQTFEVFMGIAKSCGHDRRGKVVYKRQKNGDIIFKDNEA